MDSVFSRCLERLENELPAPEFSTWIRPLQATREAGALVLYAPNAFVADEVGDRYLDRIRVLADHYGDAASGEMRVCVGAGRAPPVFAGLPVAVDPRSPEVGGLAISIDPQYRFDNFIEGKSNQLARAAAMQIAEQPGRAYNPLLLYGGTGLGKTHLMLAAANAMLERDPRRRVLYLRSEQFVNGMVKAMRAKAMHEFKRQFDDIDALLIDDIQFFAGKDATQQEFFHTFNALFDGKQQIVLTCDRYPKEVENLEPRLKSRLGWGLSVAIDPPDFETRAAILLSKADERGIRLPEDVAFLIAKRMRSNVRELEGALNTLAAQATFTGRPITVDFAQETLRDLLRAQDQALSLARIQRVVAEFYQIRVADLLSKRRTRSITRPRQLAMALAKELTSHSLPEIGDAFGGRDHTTVMHACRVMADLRATDGKLHEDFERLIRILSE